MFDAPALSFPWRFVWKTDQITYYLSKGKTWLEGKTFWRLSVHKQVVENVSIASFNFALIRKLISHFKKTKQNEGGVLGT